jgi:hypothetical protein
MAGVARSGSAWDLQGDRRDENRAGRQRFDDNDPPVAGDWLVGPSGERLAAAANGEQYFAGTIFRNGNHYPPDLAEQALFRAHGHVTGFRI